MSPHRLALALLAVLAVACTASPADEATTTTVDGVTLAVPGGWSEQQVPEDPAVVASHRWAPGGVDVRGLQVVVGCGGTVDELVAGAVQSDRGALVVTAAEEEELGRSVPGLDEARRLQLTFGAGREDDAATVRTAGLYGHAGEALVLVELSQPVRSADGDLADLVLGSVSVDRDVVAAACEDWPEEAMDGADG